MIGRVVAALEARGLADDTLMIVVADHGESIVDHDMFFNTAISTRPTSTSP